MRISSNFNRFMHGVVLKQVKEIRYLKVRHLKSAFRPFYTSDATLKELLKYLDPDYPRGADGKPFSYRVLSPKDMLSHIAFIETLLAENGISLDYKEFERE